MLQYTSQGRSECKRSDVKVIRSDVKVMFVSPLKPLRLKAFCVKSDISDTFLEFKKIF